jgi:hypothetical protein
MPYEGLKPFATERQWQYLQALAEHGTERAAASALGVHHASVGKAKKAVETKAARQGWSPEHDHTRTVPDGYMLRGVSTYYRTDKQTGVTSVGGQWVKTKEDHARQWELFKEAADAFASELPRVDPTEAPQVATDDLLSCYPIGDHHLGMLAWDKETGDDYDLSIGEHLLHQSINHLVSISPKSKRALVAVLGDFMHYDSFKAMTPTSGNLLDADSRFPKMVRAAIRALRATISSALGKHQNVHVVVEVGNHDLASSIFLMECLAALYENEPRVTVDTSPMHYHYYTFGKCMIMTHHGHGPKMQDLPLIMATDRPKDWGETEHRFIWTGHIHHWSAKDFPGCSVESFRVLPPPDAWAHQKGYRPIRDMRSIILHRTLGERARYIVSPDMFERAA